MIDAFVQGFGYVSGALCAGGLAYLFWQFLTGLTWGIEEEEENEL